MEKANPNGLVLLGTNRLEKKNLTCFTLSYKFLLVLSMWGWGYQMWGEMVVNLYRANVLCFPRERV